MVSWLVEYILTYDHAPEHLKEKVYQRFRELYIEPVTSDRMVSMGRVIKNFFIFAGNLSIKITLETLLQKWSMPS